MEQNKKFNLFKLLQNIALIGIMLVIGLVVIFTTGAVEVNNVLIEFTIIVGLLLFGVLLVLPWAKYLEQKQYKIISIVFLVAVAICVILWIICTAIIFHAYRAQNVENLSVVHLVRVTLIISFQVIVASFIGNFIIKYQAKYIPFQAIAYLSILYLDFYLSALLCGIVIQPGEITYSASTWQFVAAQWPFLMLACIYLGVVYGIITNSRKRRVRNAILGKSRKLNKDIGLIDLEDDDDEPTKPTSNDVETQLEKIKSMYDKGLITKEEYDAKRQSIIDKM